ncbi:MAG: cation diffusion facilitator family transporter [Bacillota bacterium]|nr:cation diffusion facilitator family transporter [Bacillota bacterium]
MKVFLWRTFVKDYENYKDPDVRGGYTKLTGTLGVIVNSVLCITKIILGFMINSIAVVADGFHDFADSLAACITLVASHISRKPADRKHPFGHARVEYLASLLVAVIILIVGYQLMRSSITKCMHPEPTDFSWAMVIFMCAAILVKGAQALFTIATGKHIGSLPVIAAGVDNRNDCITGIAIVASMLIHQFAGIDLDGYMGCLVSLFVLWTGISIIRETVGPLIGEPVDQEMVGEMRDIILQQPEIMDTHDIIIYNYGPGRKFASFHAQMDSRTDLMSAHAAIDQVERDLKARLHIDAAGHVDPIVMDDPVRIKMDKIISETVDQMDSVESYHDVRIIPGKNHQHVIFDIVIKPEYMAAKDESVAELKEAIAAVDDRYQVIINVDQAFA